MTEYLKKSAENYNKLTEDELLIHPMSSIDGEIITELYEIFKKIGVDDVVKALKQYKYLKDDEIRDKLLQFNTDNSDMSKLLFGMVDKSIIDDLIAEAVVQFKEDQKQLLIDFEGKILRVRYLNSVEKRDSKYFDQNTGGIKNKYQIIINSTNSESSVREYSNYVFSFDFREDRDGGYDHLKALLECTGKIRFLSNNINDG